MSGGSALRNRDQPELLPFTTRPLISDLAGPCRMPTVFGMANLIPCPSCCQMVSSMAASCPKCGHPFRSVSTNVGLNELDFAGIGLCTLSVLLFLGGAIMRARGVIGEDRAGDLLVFCLTGVVLGLILMAVGRVLAGSGKR